MQHIVGAYAMHWRHCWLDMHPMQRRIGGVVIMKYTCYSEACATVTECCECSQEVIEYGKVYDWDDYSYELQERFVMHGMCCECGSDKVEQ